MSKVRTSKPALERFFFIDQKVRSGVFPSTSDLGDELGVSYKTIQRDIDFMRDRLRAPIDYDTSRKGWYYTEQNYVLPLSKLPESDLRALQNVSKALESIGPIPGLDTFRAFLRAATPEQPDTMSVSFGPRRPVNHDVLGSIERAIRKRETLRIDYRRTQGHRADDRLLDPLHLRAHAGDWYLAAFCHRSREVRLFAVHRIASVAATGKTFAPPRGFNATSFFSNGIGIERGTKRVNVALRLKGFAAQIAQETTFHSSEKKAVRRDGSVLLKLRVSGLTDVAMWAMARGPEVEVLAPKELRKMVAAELRQAAALYR